MGWEAVSLPPHRVRSEHKARRNRTLSEAGQFRVTSRLGTAPARECNCSIGPDGLPVKCSPALPGRALHPFRMRKGAEGSDNSPDLKGLEDGARETPVSRIVILGEE